MSKFKVGDRAVVTQSLHGKSVGAVVLIASGAFLATNLRSHGGVPVACHEIVGDVPSTPGIGPLICPVAWLEPLPDDGHLAGEWTEELRELCKPRKVMA